MMLALVFNKDEGRIVQKNHRRMNLNGLAEKTGADLELYLLSFTTSLL